MLGRSSLENQATEKRFTIVADWGSVFVPRWRMYANLTKILFKNALPQSRQLKLYSGVGAGLSRDIPMVSPVEIAA